MATSSYSFDLSSVSENFGARVVNPAVQSSIPRFNFELCPMCSKGLNEEQMLPCSHSVCGSCIQAHRCSPVLVCPVCRYEHEYDFSLYDHSSMEKIINDIIQTTSQDRIETEREPWATCSATSSNTSPPNSTPTHGASPITNGNGSYNGGLGYKSTMETSASSGAIPKIRSQSYQSLNNNNKYILSNSFNDVAERQPPVTNVQLNDLLFQKENHFNAVKIPPLSPIVGGETRSTRVALALRQRAASFPETEINGHDKERIVKDIPACLHGLNVAEYYCTPCKIAFCNICASEHQNHRFTPLRETNNQLRGTLQDMLKEAQSREKHVENGHLKSQTVLENLEMNKMIAEKDIEFTSKKLIESIEQRKNHLMRTLNQVYSVKSETLVKQINTLKNVKYHLIMIQRGILSKIESNETEDLINTHVTISDNLKKMEHIALQLNPQEDATISYNFKLKRICDHITNLGSIHSMACAANTKVFGVNTEIALINTPSYFTVRCCDHLGENRTSGGDDVQALLTYPSGKRMSLTIKDYDTGEYAAMFVSHERGVHTLIVTLRGLPIFNSIQKPLVKYRRPYKDIKYPPLDTFGKGPNNQTSLSRGWGIHCDRDGFIYVTERDIHCVLVFGPDLNFIRKFGHYGDRDGELNRPAGITIDVFRRIVVVDKDNHRVQIFTMDGEYISRFGRRGSGNGEFQYPWDVDANSKGQILVSDSRNHRVQLFDKDGTFMACTDDTLGKCNFKMLEIPRGVCFDAQGQIYVVDFNNHHILVLSPHLQLLHTIGRYGEGEGQFFRPQGIFVDSKGYVFVVESKNSRAQILTPNFKFFSIIASNDKKKPFAPCDVTMSPDGYVYVVDIDIGCVYKL